MAVEPWPQCKTRNICAWRDTGEFVARRIASSRIKMGEPRDDGHYLDVSSWRLYAFNRKYALSLGVWRQH